MDSCWHPKSMINQKRKVPEGFQKAPNFQDHFCPLLVLSWANLAPSWRPGQPKTAPKSAQEPPETDPKTLLRAF